MSKQSHPKELRLGHISRWSSRWFKEKNLKQRLKEEHEIRTIIYERFANGAIDEIVIERSPEEIQITIHSARPGLIIGRGGEEINKLKEDVKQKVGDEKKIDIEIKEIRKPGTQAAIVAQNVVEQLQRRVPYRRAMKRALDKIPIDRGPIKGAKIQVSGRLNGVSIARTEWLSEGKIPLQKIRGKIDYSFKEAHTKWGSIGVKVWIYKGEVFEEEENH